LECKKVPTFPGEKQPWNHLFFGGQLRSVTDHSRLLCYEVLIFEEFVHFWSGAAGYDLKQLALNAFGNKDENRNDWTAQLTQAKSDFPG